jgi:hypothetical protein
MTTEEIAARYSNEPGYTLIDVAEVALPIWSIEVEALVIAKKEISLVDEFILRCIDVRLSSVDQLSGFLGLNEKFLQRRLSGLMSSDSIRYGRSNGSVGAKLSLTSKGAQALHSLKSEVARQENISYLYDGISRNLITIPRNGEVLRKAREIQMWGLLEIPPLPTLPPTDEVLRGLDFNSCIPMQVKKRSRIHQVLSLERIGQRRKLFREARMLVYSGVTPGDIKVAFFSIHGRPLPEINTAFARNGGIQKLNLPTQIEESREALKNLRKDALVKAGFEAERQLKQSAKRKEVEVARENILVASQIDDAERKLKDAESEVYTKELEGEVALLKQKLAEIQQQQASKSLRKLTVFEHKTYFEQALREASHRLMIVSPWINDHVMNERRITSIQLLAARNVQIYIGYGFDDDNTPGRGRDRDPEDTRAYKQLAELSRKYSSIHLVRIGNTHAKLLLMDSKFAIAGSFNWMSFNGDKGKKFREEISYMSTDGNFVDQEFEDYLQNFNAPKNNPRINRDRPRQMR